MINACLITGAILSVLVSIAHSVLGERYILTRLFHRSSLPELFGSDLFTRQTLRFAWHLSSVAWIGLAGVLVSLTIPDPLASRDTTLFIISITFLIHAVITLMATRGRHLAWIVFLAIAAAAWMGRG
jgi:hypothetical protein